MSIRLATNCPEALEPLTDHFIPAPLIFTFSESDSMERNYDELFAEMLLSIDLNAEELEKHSNELTRVSLEVDH